MKSTQPGKLSESYAAKKGSSLLSCVSFCDAMTLPITHLCRRKREFSPNGGYFPRPPEEYRVVFAVQDRAVISAGFRSDL